MKSSLVGVLFGVLVFSTSATWPADAPPDRPLRLGVIVFNGFELLDIMGPLEMLGQIRRDRLQIVIVSKEAGEIRAAQGTRTVADYGLRDAPDLDLLLVSGGNVYGAMRDEDVLKWLRERGEKAQIVTSVCNGALLIAKAGLLDGRRATSNKAGFAQTEKVGANVEWVRQARWVDDGNRITSSGVSAGIDMSLHLIARLFGQEEAERIAKGTEYIWNRDPNVDPFAAVHE
jgi:transcriptional regulator GlxA family with amidase domain